MILGIQLAGIFFALFMLYLTFLHKKRNQYTITEYGFWTLVWFIFIFFIIFPHSFDFVIKDMLNFNRTFDFFVVAGFMFTITSILYIYDILRKIQGNEEVIVRELAINKAYIPNKKKEIRDEQDGK